MAVITAAGYSFGPFTPGYALSGFTSVIGVGPYLPGYATFSNIDDKLLMWQSPYFINQNCPTVGPARPTTGQVYPRGYS